MILAGVNISSKTSLKRCVKERHVDEKFYLCAVSTCNAEFIRRSDVLTHLKKIHGMDRKTEENI